MDRYMLYAASEPGNVAMYLKAKTLEDAEKEADEMKLLMKATSMLEIISYGTQETLAVKLPGSLVWRRT